MKDFRNTRGGRAAAVLVAALVLLSQSLPAGAARAPQGPKEAARVSEEQRIVHVLNRLGYGARPGDVERVRRTGLARYIEQQLNPSQIPDEVVEAKLGDFPTLSMSTAELLAKYPSPGQLIRQLQRRGELPADLAEIVGQRGRGRPAPAAAAAGEQAETMGGSMSKPEDAGPGATTAAADDNPERREYRRAVGAYMRGRGLEPPQRIMQELQSARLLRAVYSERQLQEVLVDFWSNHFNVFAQKGADRWFLTAYDRDVIRPHALGNFRELIEATAKSPAMLFYLDNFQSVSPDARGDRRGGLRRRMMQGPEAGAAAGEGGGERPNAGAMRRQQRPTRRRAAEASAADTLTRQGEPQMGGQPPRPRRPRRGINENYARELLELHTLGVEGGYTQKDVQEVARAFTGWTIVDPRGRAGTGSGGTFLFNPRLHDDGEKVVLGQRIPAGGGMRDGQLVLDILVRHPSTAKFIATKLARRFVSDTPPPALVARAAAAFSKSSGDIRETLRAIFASPEFNSAEARRAKIKTPFELAVSAIRVLGAETDARPALHQWVARMGEPLYLYQAPTGYPDVAEHWVNTGALLERLNFALALASNRIPGTRVDLSRFAGEASAGPGGRLDRRRVADEFIKLVLQGELSEQSRAVLLKQLAEQPVAAPGAGMGEAASQGRDARGGRRQQGRPAGPSAAGDPEVTRIAALVLGSPEFQRQ